MSPKPSPISVPGQEGFSIIELMVATLILGIAVTGVMSILETGRGWDSRNRLLQEARIVARSSLEDSAFHYSNYASLASGVINRTATLDPGTAHPISADVQIQILPEVTETSWSDVAGFGSPTISTKTIKASVHWIANGEIDTVLVIKRIAEVR